MRTLITLSLSAAAFSLATLADAKPLKVFILAGQSNMEGHAQTKTLPAVARDPKTADLHKAIVDEKGEPRLHKDIWVSYAYGNFAGDNIGRKTGQLTTGFGSQHHVGTGKIGPELTFGITMHEELGEPILLIKNAWGGKSLMVDYRPPSAGEITDNEKAKDKAGRYYAYMMEHVQEVLADPKKIYPDYDAKEGVELAGFVWFQGFNDLVGPYPRVEPAQGKKSVKDYSEYSRLLSCFIRDVRKDLKAPELPFVIGVLGTGGESAGDNADAFRAAMAAPGESDEFKGSVANVFTHKYWPTEIDEVMAKVNAVKSEFAEQDRDIKKRQKAGEEWRKDAEALQKKKDAKIKEALTEEEMFQYEYGRSNQGFHYHGSAKFFAQIGKAFAEALTEMDR